MPSPLRLLGRAAPAGLPLARTVIRAGLARVFGPPPFDPLADPGDPGLYGPGSASWHLLAEPAAIVGGIRALVVQLLHPLAMAGVADHSVFREDPLGRLHATARYVTATTFGSTGEALATARAVRQAHLAVRGTAPDGRWYSACSPHLLGWVSIALTSSFLATDHAYAPRPLTPAEADAYVDQQAVAAALLDPRVDLDAIEGDADALAALRAGRLDLPMRDDGTLPRTRDELRSRLSDYADELALNHQGRDAMRFLLFPPLPAAVRAGYLPLLAGAVATLTVEERHLVGLPINALTVGSTRIGTQTLLTGLRLAVGTSPSASAASRRVSGSAASGDGVSDRP